MGVGACISLLSLSPFSPLPSTFLPSPSAFLSFFILASPILFFLLSFCLPPLSLLSLLGSPSCPSILVCPFEASVQSLSNQTFFIVSAGMVGHRNLVFHPSMSPAINNFVNPCQLSTINVRTFKPCIVFLLHMLTQRTL